MYYAKRLTLPGTTFKEALVVVSVGGAVVDCAVVGGSGVVSVFVTVANLVVVVVELELKLELDLQSSVPLEPAAIDFVSLRPSDISASIHAGVGCPAQSLEE